MIRPPPWGLRDVVAVESYKQRRSYGADRAPRSSRCSSVESQRDDLFVALTMPKRT